MPLLENLLEFIPCHERVTVLEARQGCGGIPALRMVLLAVQVLVFVPPQEIGEDTVEETTLNFSSDKLYFSRNV